MLKMNNNQYTTLSEAVQHLQQRGYTVDFLINEEGELVENDHSKFSPSDVRLNEFHRFEGTSDPADMSIVYALETRSGVKGTVIDSFGVDGTESISDFMNHVKQGQYGL